MPDWLTHTLAGWITGKTIKIDIGLVVIGSLIPDLVKIKLAFTWLNIDHHHFLDTLHTPIGSLIIAAIIALLFQKTKNALLFLSIGIATHFFLDILLVHVSGGIRILFPFSWEEYHLYILRPDDYTITIIALSVAIIVYGIYWYRDKQKNMNNSVNIV